jgi:hypothetical protein
MLYILLIGSLLVCKVSTGKTTASCQLCLNLFSTEFDKSKVKCAIETTGICDCTFKLMDLSACVYTSIRDKRSFNLVVNTVIGAMDENNKYSSKCRRIIQEQGFCTLGDISDPGFVIPIWNVIFGTISLICQLLSVYRVVSIIIYNTVNDLHVWPFVKMSCVESRRGDRLPNCILV